jgi:hypothetical protein
VEAQMLLQKAIRLGVSFSFLFRAAGADAAGKAIRQSFFFLWRGLLLCTPLSLTAGLLLQAQTLHPPRFF